jgi:FAD/FMN-containing dehydrogenase
LRETISEAQKIEGISIKHDISVPVSKIAEFVERTDRALSQAFPEIRIVTFGHLGDGNLHYNQSKPEAGENAAFISSHSRRSIAIVHDLAHELGGSISAEHGIGQLKRRGDCCATRSAVEMEMMRARSSAPSTRRV